MKKNILPVIENIQNDYNGNKKLLILSEGFEERSLSFISTNHTSFDSIILCKYFPEKSTKYIELNAIISKYYSSSKIYEIIHNRFDPFNFEIELLEKIDFFNYPGFYAVKN